MDSRNMTSQQAALKCGHPHKHVMPKSVKNEKFPSKYKTDG